jgi:SAM-dependent methyltransferase
MRLALPRPGHLPKTGPVDWIERYHTPGIGYVLRQRLRWMLRSFPDGRIGRALEIGCGSGVFQYTLAARAALSIALDLHEMLPTVRDRLAEDGLRPALVRGDGDALPFRDESFDLVIIVSALEFVPDPARCLRESRRVLHPQGRLVCLVPRDLRWADAAFRLLTRRDPETEFKAARARVTDAIARVLPDASRQLRPFWLGALAPYEIVTATR